MLLLPASDLNYCIHIFSGLAVALAVLAPITFALIATLGTLKIIGHPLDIPGIMLWIIIMGMGINYSIYYVCFYQRYRDESLPEMDTVKLAMFLASFTTLIGFGVLAFASHALLRSIGIVSLLGIFYSLIGAYFILPVLMKKIFISGSISRRQVHSRFARTPSAYGRTLPASGRLSACFRPHENDD